jgi:alanine dehydrogenase
VIIGVPKETERLEHRIGLTPAAVARLVHHEHSVVVERDAGTAAHFTDQDFAEAGAETVYTAEEVYRRSDLVCQVGAVTPSELDLIEQGLTICAFQHLAVSPRETIERLCALETTIIGYEVIVDEEGDRPVLLSTSDLAGQLAIHEAAHLLQIQSGGRGVLLGNTPTIPPATVVILGAGAVGNAAAEHASALGAHVIVLDADVRKLQSIFQNLGGRVVTAMASPSQLARFIPVADAVVGAVLIPAGGRAPFLVTEELVKTMKKGSVIVDVSIDQGGCIETSRPTLLDHPTFTEHGVVHYCVPNMTSNIARTASRSMANAAMPYIGMIADSGLDQALLEDPGLAEGVYLYRGKIVNEAVARLMGVDPQPLAGLLKRGAGR